MLGSKIRKSLVSLIEQFQLSGVDRKKSDFQRIMRSALRKESTVYLFLSLTLRMWMN